MGKNVLITGGTGFLGQHLLPLLRQRGWKPMLLSRSPQPDAETPAFAWDPSRGELDTEAIRQANHIIHLAGAGIADRRWTKKRKAEIIASRTQGTQLLFDSLKNMPNQVQTFVGASAIGYYGNSGGLLQTEDMPPSTSGFMAEVCRLWEESLQQIAGLPNMRTAIARIGIVLGRGSGALPQMAMPAKFGMTAYMGNGRQHLSWIHIDDMCRILLLALENESVDGVYNAVAPQPATNRQFMKTLAHSLHRPALGLPVPAFALRLALGEMADMVLHGSKVSSQKIMDAGYVFQFPDLEGALENLLG